MVHVSGPWPTFSVSCQVVTVSNDFIIVRGHVRLDGHASLGKMFSNWQDFSSWCVFLISWTLKIIFAQIGLSRIYSAMLFHTPPSCF
jgi:hypothetical protein